MGELLLGDPSGLSKVPDVSPDNLLVGAHGATLVPRSSLIRIVQTYLHHS